MDFGNKCIPNAFESFGVLGYLIITDKQIHNYQLEILSDYLSAWDKTIDDTVIGNILDGKNEALSFEDALNHFSNEAEDIQKSIIHCLVELASIDDVIDENEINLISKIKTVSKLSNDAFENIFSDAKESASKYRLQNNVVFERQDIPSPSMWKRLEGFFARTLKLLKKEKLVNEPASNVDYKSIISRCAVIAQEDFNVVSPCFLEIINTNNDCLNTLIEYKRSISLANDISAEVALIVKTYIDAINDNVIAQTKEAEASLLQKQRTVPDFTISLMGRTKAGKSTLHAILTRQGYDKIGVGKQRTTKYNRVYQWNLIRLIDTPGIGSAEADGRSDDEIAESILGESDVICFVVVDDSILKDVLDLIDKVAALNKPIIILLNHKENIRNNVKFRRFIDDPEKWLNDTGESNLSGHINRIKTYAESKGYSDLVRVFPVFLLAAQMSREPEYNENKIALWNGSNIESFINQLKNWIIYSGSIKRSQTILDEAVQNFNKSKNQIIEANEPVDAHIERLRKQRKEKIEFLHKQLLITTERIGKLYQERLRELANVDALSFAEEAYTQKDSIGELWTAYIDRIGFKDDIETMINSEVGIFLSQIDDVVKELFEDFYFAMKTNFSIRGIKIPTQADYKSIVRIGGELVGLAGSIVLLVLGASNSVGWVITIAGILISLGSNLFLSKEKRRQKAINKIHSSMKESILKDEDKQIREMKSQVELQLSKQISNIDKIFEDLINGMLKMKSVTGVMSEAYRRNIEWINKVYAWRIIQYISDSQEPFDIKRIESTIKSVNRNNPKEIIIKTAKKNCGDTNKLIDIISETIRFE